MFKFRIISFPLLLALLGYMIFGGLWGMYIFFACAPLMIGATIYEFLTMLKNAGVKTFPKATAIIFVVLFALSLSPKIFLTIALFVLIMAIFLALVFIKEENRLAFISQSTISFGTTILLLSCFLPLIYVYAISPIALLFLALTTKMMDTGGYIFGMLSNKILPNGNHKILPTISPKKSYEGTIGGILFSVAAGLILWHLEYSPFSLTITVISSIIFAIGSFAGDLTESAIKRCCGVKDSGNIIPGMGGVFDVLDSFIYNGMIFAIIWGIWGF